jgi:hypothetical protein
LIVLTHILYGWGFWRGLFTSLKTPAERQPTPVALEIVKAGEVATLQKPQ